MLVLGALAGSVSVFGQGRAAAPAGGRAGGPPPSARATAPFDPTGYWVAIISEDWRWRMVTPAKGDVVSIPLSAEGLRVAEAWDPAKDEAAGEQCKAYGAPGLMRGPIRLHITWQDDNTLRIDTDAGTQTRLFRFTSSASSSAPPSWQGESIATWERATGPDGGGSLRVVTTNLRAGYLRKNGVPYSERTTVAENLDVTTLPDGSRLLLVTITVEDPVYLTGPYITSPHFKKEPDGSKWEPTPCSSTW